MWFTTMLNFKLVNNNEHVHSYFQYRHHKQDSCSLEQLDYNKDNL